MTTDGITAPPGVHNTDAAELARYAALADTWWSTTGPFWPLHRLNALRIEYIRDLLCERYGRNTDNLQPLHGLRVLDVGCGGGILSESVALLGAEVHGIDVVERNIATAQLHARQSGLAIRYELRDVESLVRAGAEYDVVLNMEVVEHVPDASAFMRACAALVSADGMMFVATINRTLRGYLFAILGAEYVLRWLPRGTHQWYRFCKPTEIEPVLRQCGFTIESSTGVRVNPLTRRFSLSRDLSVNYMLAAERSASGVAVVASE